MQPTKEQEGHLGMQNFNVKIVKKTFISHVGLWQHTKSQHEGVKYACNQCDYQAAERGNLKKHIKSQHNSVK